MDFSGGVGSSYRSDSLNCAFRTCRSKNDISCELGGGGKWHATPVGGCICCTEEMDCSLLLGQVFLNLGSGNFSISFCNGQTGLCNKVCKDEGSYSGSDCMWRYGMDPNHTDLQVLS